jgi:hypothetical protein
MACGFIATEPRRRLESLGMMMQWSKNTGLLPFNTHRGPEGAQPGMDNEDWVHVSTGRDHRGKNNANAFF